MSGGIEFAAISHRGRVRRENQDNLYCDGGYITPEEYNDTFVCQNIINDSGILAVFDGMGGMDEGRFAALASAEELDGYYGGIMGASSESLMDEAVQRFVAGANQRICHRVFEINLKMGSTLAMAVFKGGLMKAYNLGDSKIYVFREGKIEQITKDHTVVAQKIMLGLIDAEQAKTDRDRGKLTQYVGANDEGAIVTAYVCPPLKLCHGDKIILCTDGFADVVDIHYIETVLDGAASAKEAVSILMADALKNGGSDNITCIIADVHYS